MKLIFLSKENVQMARGEAEALLGKGKLIDNLFFIENDNITDRLAYSKFISRLLFEAKENDVDEKIKRFQWNKIVKGRFALFYLEDFDKTSQSLSRKYGGRIYDLLKNPKVDLENPKTKILVIKNRNKLYFCLEEWKNDERFFDRRPSSRPGQQPVTLQPKLARACINLTGSKTSIYDPFCGVGGFLIEAGLMKLKAIGSDINNKMIDLCKKNLEHYKIKNYNVFRQNALEIDKKYDYIVTDPPYGKGSRIVGKDLYLNFLISLRKNLGKRAVVMFPHYIKAEKIIKKSKLKIKAKYSAYMHKSLTREIYVLEK